MDFSFNINDILKDEVTKVDSQLQICKRNGTVDRFGFKQLQRMLYEIVDSMGDASAKAQGLRGTITTGKKLETSPHRLYIMKDSNGNGGKGSAVGILKVGTKKLFVYDHSKQQHELDPLCVLDFYVHESRQRMGCGKKLFSSMLQHEGISAHHLAIDKPSQKFSSFLKKHYNLKSTIPQVNNFVIFDGFFNNRSDIGKGRQQNINDGRPPLTPVRQNSGSERSQVSNLSAQSRLSHASNNNTQWHPGQKRNNDAVNQVNVSGRQQQNGNMGAGDMNYSRHGPSPTNTYSGSNSAINNLPLDRQSALSPHGQLFKQMNSGSSPYMYYNTGMNATAYYGQPNRLPPKYPSQNHNQFPDNASQGQMSETPNSGQRLMGAKRTHSLGNRTPSPLCDPRYPAKSTVTRLPDINTQGSEKPGTVNHRPPSGNKRQSNNREPPLLQRDGPPKNYSSMMNMHQVAQDRTGRLRTGPNSGSPAYYSSPPIRTNPTQDTQKTGPSAYYSSTPVLSNPTLDSQKAGSPAYYSAASKATQEAPWSVSGVLRSQRHTGGQQYTTTRLW